MVEELHGAGPLTPNGMHIYSKHPHFLTPSKLSQYFFSKAIISEKQKLASFRNYITYVGYLSHPRWHLDNDGKTRSAVWSQLRHREWSSFNVVVRSLSPTL